MDTDPTTQNDSVNDVSQAVGIKSTNQMLCLMLQELYGNVISHNCLLPLR